MLDDFESLGRAYARGWAPPPRLSVAAWADEYRKLAPGAGSTTGDFRTARVEVARGPMLAVTEPGVRVISLMVCTQLLKTTVLENAFGYFAHLDPCPMLLLQPKGDAAKQYSKERIQPMIRYTPVLRELMGAAAARAAKDDDTLLYKPFAGGFLALGSGSTADDVARRPIRVLFADEIDKWIMSREGDHLGLAEERMGTYDANSLSIRACSPTVGEESRIETSYLESDQRAASVECPHCRHRMFPSFATHVDYDKRRRADGTVVEALPKTAGIVCEACGVKWSEGERLQALGTIRWHQTRIFECCGERRAPLETYGAAWRERLALEAASDAVGKPEVRDPLALAWDWWEDTADGRFAVYRARCPACGAWGVSNEHAGFQAGKLLSPWQRDTPVQIATKWINAQGNHDRLQAWWNTQAGLPYRAISGRTLDVADLLARREVWPGKVPPQAGLLTASMDTQDTWVELETIAWGTDEESWSIDHTVIEGEFKDPAVQAKVDAYLARVWLDQHGRQYRVAAACLDSGGHHVQHVYEFCKARLQRRIWAIKGASERDGARNPVWPTKRPSKRTKATFRPIMLGGNTARDTIRARLTQDPPEAGQPCPGYMHFPHDRDVGYFQQLTADRRELRERGGKKYTVWVTPAGRANEAADLKVYGYAALCGLVHLGLQLNTYVARVLQAPTPLELGVAPPEMDAPAPRPKPPAERKMSITQAPLPGGDAITSRIA